VPSLRAAEATVFLGDLVKFQKRVLHQVLVEAKRSYKAHLDSTMFFSLALAYCDNEQRPVFLYILVTTYMFTSELAFLNDHCVTVRMMLAICPKNMLSFDFYASSEFDCPLYQALSVSGLQLR
jgi:hypothetical protein